MRTIKRKYLQLQSCLLHQTMIQVKTLMKTMMSSPLQLLCQSLLCQRRKLIVLILMIAALMKTIRRLPKRFPMPSQCLCLSSLLRPQVLVIQMKRYF
ncbi:hypothetical protein VIGAN_04141000, partial [Vigna angularis var. angularis]